MPTWITLAPLASFSDLTLLLVRLLAGAFLVHGVWDNIVDPARMAEFVAFQRQVGFPRPDLLAPFSVWVQFACGVAFLLGLAVRPAGLVCAVHFAVACVMVHWAEDLRGWWPAAVLVVIGLDLAARGSGRFGLDTALGAR